MTASEIELENGSTSQRDGGALTLSVVIICICAASAGLVFGYDVGVTGGVTTMPPFLEKFFPTILMKMADAKQDEYCMYDSQILTLFTSSFYISGVISSLIAGRVASIIGRKGILVVGGIIFLTGTALNAFAINVAMLISGRLLLGIGVGFTNQSAPVYLTEMAPARWRGTLLTAFQTFLCAGVVLATLINFGSMQYGVNGWRVALGCAGIPGIIMTVAALFIPDTPRSLIQRGKIDEARKSLNKVKCSRTDTEAELNELVKSINADKNADQDPFRKLLQSRYRPHLVIVVMIALFQQLTGVGLVAFYAPVLLHSVGTGISTALRGAVILGAVNLLSTLVSAYVADKIGRKILFLEGGIQIILSEVAIAVVLALQTNHDHFTSHTATLILVFMCFISAAFGWSWGPLTFMVPAEILPMDLRAAGQGICVAVSFVVTFILTQLSLTMLCHFKYGIFLFYAAMTVLMTLFTSLFVPETKGITLESMDEIFEDHWYWRRYVTTNM